MSGADEMLTRVLADEDATVAFGRELHDAIRQRLGDTAVVYLHGNLGAENYPWYAGLCG